MTKKLIALLSTEGKTPEQIQEEVMAAMEKFKKASSTTDEPSQQQAAPETRST